MNFRTTICLFCLAPLLVSCGKLEREKVRQQEEQIMAAEKKDLAAAEAARAGEEKKAEAVAQPAEPAFKHDPTAQVTVIGYHRFEDPARDELAITPKEFEEQMQALKDAGIEVISMEDFLAWKDGQKNIPAKSAIITIDDGYDSAYHVAWPILKKFGYPFTYYVYLNYISAGGKSITWEELEEMRDAGVDIGCHSWSHASLKRKRRHTDESYAAFLRKEMLESKRELEVRLGVPVRTFSYPYGHYSNDVLSYAQENCDYDALFTVYGKPIAYATPDDEVGRYIVLSGKPEIFRMATRLPGASQGVLASKSASEGGESNTFPAQGEVVRHPRPLITAKLDSLDDIDPASVRMTVSSFGLVPCVFDEETKTVTYQVRRQLVPKTYHVTVSLTSGGKKQRLRWNFDFERGTVAEEGSEASLTPQDGEAGAASSPAESQES